MALVSQAEFARRMKVSRQYIGQLVKSGTIPLAEKNKIDFEAASIIFVTHRDQNERNNQEWSKEQKGKGAVKASEKRIGGTATPSKAKNNEPSWGAQFQKARTAEKALKVRFEKIKLERLEKSLIPVDSVKRQVEFIANTVRNRLNKLPSKYAGRLVGLTIVEIEETLTEGIDEILEEFQDMLKDVKKKSVQKPRKK